MAHESFGQVTEGKGQVLRSEGRERVLVLPDPPIGQLNVEQILKATPEELWHLCQKRFNLPLENLLSEEGKKDSWYPGAWSKTDRMRLAVLYADGKSSAEIADAFDAARSESQPVVSENNVRVSANKWISRGTSELAAANRLIRRWHAVLAPENPRTERLLSAIEEKLGMQRDKIFYGVEEASTQKQKGREARMLRAVPEGGRASIADVDIAIRLLHLKLVEGMPASALAEVASTITGTRVDEKRIGALVSRVLTPKVKEKLPFNQQEKMDWTEEKLRRVASLLLDPRYLYSTDIAAETGYGRVSILNIIRRTGEKIKKKNAPKYDQDPPFVAFLMEYGDASQFPDASAMREAAMGKYWVWTDNVTKGKRRHQG